MEEITCAVCAENLEWVAYGSCKHQVVCSMCVARLRFVCKDRRCCICQTESTIMFVTKALGDDTKTIDDFSVFPLEEKEGPSGSYWYHEDTQSYIDDLNQYETIKAMYRSSCSICYMMVEKASDLNDHLRYDHMLFMCSLCLERKKVFLCEQKVYNKAQLEQHINTGDSEVDGTESERGGFQGHPLCEFCRLPFYGDNELYNHMNTAHYTCHICRRHNPDQHEYFKNYNDLEIHFSQEHFLCKDEECLSKKFVVFKSEPELKTHNALEHAGHVQRANRKVVLQLTTSFTYRQTNFEDELIRGIEASLEDEQFQEIEGNLEQLRATEASLETADANTRFPEAPSLIDPTTANSIHPLIQPFESLATSSDRPSGYLMAVSRTPRNATLEGPAHTARNPTLGLLRNTSGKTYAESHRPRNATSEGSSFPTLFKVPAHTARSSTAGLLWNTSGGICAESHRPRNATLEGSPFPPPFTSRARTVGLAGNTTQEIHAMAHKPRNEKLEGSCPPPSTGPAHTGRKPTAGSPKNTMAEIYAGRTKTKSMPSIRVALGLQQPINKNQPSSSSVSIPANTTQRKSTINQVQAPPFACSSTSSSWKSTSQINHSTSVPDLVDIGPVSDFPPVSTLQACNVSPNGQSTQSMEEFDAAMKLREVILAGLNHDQDKYAAFNELSLQYRQGVINAEMYLVHVEKFGLCHLVHDLVNEEELTAVYDASQTMICPKENERDKKGKSVVAYDSNSTTTLTRHIKHSSGITI